MPDVNKKASEEVQEQQHAQALANKVQQQWADTHNRLQSAAQRLDVLNDKYDKDERKQPHIQACFREERALCVKIHYERMDIVAIAKKHNIQL